MGSLEEQNEACCLIGCLSFSAEMPHGSWSQMHIQSCWRCINAVTLSPASATTDGHTAPRPGNDPFFISFTALIQISHPLINTRSHVRLVPLAVQNINEPQATPAPPTGWSVYYSHNLTERKRFPKIQKNTSLSRLQCFILKIS